MKTIDQYHKWVEWSEDDQVYIGKCPDLITGIHGTDPIQVYEELCDVVEGVITSHLEKNIPLPPASIRPMKEVA
jgi:hypothetical protein